MKRFVKGRGKATYLQEHASVSVFTPHAVRLPAHSRRTATLVSQPTWGIAMRRFLALDAHGQKTIELPGSRCAREHACRQLRQRQEGRRVPS